MYKASKIEIEKRKDNQEEWQVWGRKYKIKSKILEVNVKNLKKNQPIVEEKDNSINSNAPEAMQEEEKVEVKDNSMDSNEPDNMQGEEIPDEDILHTEGLSERTCDSCKKCFISTRVLQEHIAKIHIKNFK